MRRKIKILDRKFVPAGTLIIEQGTAGNRAFYIESGEVEVFIHDGEKAVPVAHLGPESLIGEMAVLTDGHRSASVRTVKDSILIAIPAHDLQETMRASDGMYRRIMNMLHDRMEDTRAKLVKKEENPDVTEKPARLTVKNIGLHISDAEQPRFRKEITPLLNDIKSTLEKYHKPER
ncbi:MAG: cyclic nucleotide-binding domain-containing protein [Pseudomonadota bacterium]